MMRAVYFVVLSMLSLLGATARADVTPALLESYAGYVNFVGTAKSIRTQPNTSNPCSITTGNTTATVSGIPSGATILKAYLYWAGSGTTPDYTVTFEGGSVTAVRQYVSTDSAYDFFSGVADVTAAVTSKRNGTYTFTGLTVSTSSTYCSVEAVLGGWSLLVVYENQATEDFRVLNIYEGFKVYQNSSITITLGNFRTPASVAGLTGKASHISWEGDPTLSGGGENLTFNGSNLSDASNPVGNQFNSISNIMAVSPSTGTADSACYGVDFDAYLLASPLLTANMTSAATVYSSGQDLVLLSAEVIAVPNTPVADLAITKTLASPLIRGQSTSYTISVSNNGPNDEPGAITVTDTLPSGLTYNAAGTSGAGWSCSAAGQVVTCTRAGMLANGATAATLTLGVNVSATATGTIANTATVAGTQFDNVAGNNSATDSSAVAAANLSLNMTRNNDLLQGQSASYTLTVNNGGPLAETGTITVVDTLPSGLTYTSVSAGWSCSAVGQTVTCTYAGGLASGSSAALTLTVAVSGGASGTLTNTATVTGVQYDNDASNNTASDSYTVLPTAYAYYKLDGNFNDSSGNNRTATAVNGVTATTLAPAAGSKGDTCQGLSIPADTQGGTQRGVDLGYTPGALGNAGTIAFWYKSNTAWNTGNGTDDRVLLDASVNSNQEFWLALRQDGNLRFRLDSGTNNRTVTTSNYPTAAGTWVHIAITWSFTGGSPNQFMRIYVNGSLAQEFVSTSVTANTYANFLLGDTRSGVQYNNSANGLIDEVYVYSGALSAAQIAQAMANSHSCTTAADHYAITLSSTSGATCQAERVTITPHNAAHGSVTLTNTTTIALSASTGKGDFTLNTGSGSFIAGAADSGTATYTFAASPGESAVTFNYKNTWGGTVNFNVVTQSGGTATEQTGTASADSPYDPSLTIGFGALRFVDAGNLVIGPQVAGVTSGQYYLQAVQSSCTTPGASCAGVCTSVFGNGQSAAVQLAYECNNPSTCNCTSVPATCSSAGSPTLTIANSGGTDTPKQIQGNDNGASLSYTTQTLKFSNATLTGCTAPCAVAPITLNFTDVGQIRLYARYNQPLGNVAGTASGNYLSGNSQFVVRPYSMVVTDVKQTASPNTANPSAANADDVVFIPAGEPFSATVTAVNASCSASLGSYSAASSIPASCKAPNYGKETPAAEGARVSSALVSGLGLANNPTLNNPTSLGGFVGGSATGTTFSWDEVGIIRLSADVTDGDYLGAGSGVSVTTNSPNVGRFYAHHLGLAGSLVSRRDLQTTESVSPATSTTGSMAANSSILTVASAAGIAIGNRLRIAGAGTGGADLEATVSGIAGTVLTLDTAATTLVSAAYVGNTAFTYMGEPMELGLSVTAYGKNETPLQNYLANVDSAKNFAKLDATTLGTGTSWFATGCTGTSQCMGLGAVNRAASPITGLSHRLSVDGAFTPTSAWAGGVGSFTVRLRLDRDVAGPDGSYEDLRIGGMPRDSDGATLPGPASSDTAHRVNLDATTGNTLNSNPDATNERRLLAITKARYGRLRLLNAYGSELLDLRVPVRAEYYKNGIWVVNGDDALTAIANPRSSIVIGNYSAGGLGVGNLGSSQVSTTLYDPKTGLATSGSRLVKGEAYFTITTPKSSGVRGSFDMALNVGSTANVKSCSTPLNGQATATEGVAEWLTYAWCAGASNYDPHARGTLGSARSPFIYLRERY